MTEFDDILARIRQSDHRTYLAIGRTYLDRSRSNLDSVIAAVQVEIETLTEAKRDLLAIAERLQREAEKKYRQYATERDRYLAEVDQLRGPHGVRSLPPLFHEPEG